MMDYGLKDVIIGNQRVGTSHPPLILPDIDLFFNGDLSVAGELIGAVAHAGIPAIKAAILLDPDIVFDTDAQENFLGEDGTMQQVNYRELIRKKLLTRDQHASLFSHIRSAGLELVVSVYEIPAIEFACEQGAVAIKMPSSNITHRPLIEAAAKSGLPLIIDTGKASLPEVAEAISWARSAGAGDQIIIEHSPLAPPAPVERQDLSMIPYMRDVFGLHTGLSHHARGPLMILASAALGARIIEFGFCRDNEPSDQDVYHALRVSDLKPTVDQVSEIQRALGAPFSGRAAISGHNGRMSLRAKIHLNKGDLLTEENTSFSFPPLGIPANRWHEAAGRTVREEIRAGEPVYSHQID